MPRYTTHHERLSQRSMNLNSKAIGLLVHHKIAPEAVPNKLIPQLAAENAMDKPKTTCTKRLKMPPASPMASVRPVPANARSPTDLATGPVSESVI